MNNSLKLSNTHLIPIHISLNISKISCVNGCLKQDTNEAHMLFLVITSLKSFILLFLMPLVYGKLGHTSDSMSYILYLLGCFLMVLINLFSLAYISYKLRVRSITVPTLNRASAYFYPILPVQGGQTLLMFFIKFSPVVSDY